MAEHLTNKELEIVTETARAVMKEAGHICHFDDDARKRMHDFNDASKAEGADHGTFLILIQTAKGIQNFTRKAIGWFILALVIIVLSVFGGALILRP